MRDIDERNEGFVNWPDVLLQHSDVVLLLRYLSVSSPHALHQVVVWLLGLVQQAVRVLHLKKETKTVETTCKYN